jgi:hypothetical protein
MKNAGRRTVVRCVHAALLALPLLPSSAPVAAGAAAVRRCPLEIANNKPFVQVRVDRAAPEWFILDTGNSGHSIIAREYATRLGLARGEEEQTHVGAGGGTSVGLSQALGVVTLGVAGDTMTVAQPLILPLAHVARLEGRAVNGLLGADFLARHVVEIDYAAHVVTLLDSLGYVPPAGAAIVPLELDTGWPVARGSIAFAGRAPVPCRFIVDTGVRGTVTFFHPFSVTHHLLDVPGNLVDRVVGGGAGGITRGDVNRLDSLGLGPVSFARAVAVFSRDTTGVLAMADLDGILGGELLRRHRVTFDCPHGRMILEPYPGTQPPFEYDMSGLFLASDGPGFARVVVESVNPGTPAAAAGLRTGDEIASVDGVHVSLERVRALFRAPAAYRLRVKRAGAVLELRLVTRRLV